VVYILTHFYKPDSKVSLSVAVQWKLSGGYFNTATQTNKGSIFGR